jgi:hypothetical protein
VCYLDGAVVMRSKKKSIVIICMMCISNYSAMADFWSDNNPIKGLTPHWGPLIPKDAELGCIGHPTDCKSAAPPSSSRPASPIRSLDANMTRRFIYTNGVSCERIISAQSCDDIYDALNDSNDPDPCDYAFSRDDVSYTGKYKDIGGNCRLD